MHFRARTAILVAACWLGAAPHAWGQNPAALDSLRRSLSAVSARIDSLEAGLCPAAPAATPSKPSGNARADSLAATLDRLNQRVEAIRSVRCAPPGPGPAGGLDRRPCRTPGGRRGGCGTGTFAVGYGPDWSKGAGPDCRNAGGWTAGRQPSQPRDQRYRRRPAGGP